jgi:hypothetical protein
VHSFTKLITKILANRLAKRLNEMVSPNQSAFMKGRFIQDNFMLVQQTSRLLHRQNKATLLYKLDITKAFDSVSWPFLVEVMEQLGFGQIWRDIICGLLASSSTQVMLNGFPGQHIIHRRGLRQGDPLSPLLFILAMYVLVCMFSKAEEDGLLQQLSNRKELHRISLYAYDVALFVHPTAADLSITLGILQLFGMPLGCTIMPINLMSFLSDVQMRIWWRPKVCCLVEYLRSLAVIWVFLYPCTSYLGSSSNLLLIDLLTSFQVGRQTY